MIPTAVLDRLILRLLDGLGTDELEVERLIRMGATKGRRVTVEEAAHSLGSSRRALARRLREAGCPSPLTLLRWGRLIAALSAWNPARDGRGMKVSLEKVANAQDWSDLFHISTSLRMHAGIYPRDWHRQGASLDSLVELLLAQWKRRGVRALATR